MAHRVALVAALAVCCCSLAAASGGMEELQPTTYAQLKPVAGQWRISLLATKTPDKSSFQPQVCDKEALSAPCNQPLLSGDAKDKLKVEAQLKGKQLQTIDGLQPKRLLVRACYTKPSTADRPWRKANDVIDKDKSCPFVVKSAPFNASAPAVSVEWPVPKNMTKATWYAQLLVVCTNGTGTSYCQADSTKNATYWGTATINSTPLGMVVATAVASAIGPLFLGAFFLKDHLARGKAAQLS